MFLRAGLVGGLTVRAHRAVLRCDSGLRIGRVVLRGERLLLNDLDASRRLVRFPPHPVEDDFTGAHLGPRRFPSIFSGNVNSSGYRGIRSPSSRADELLPLISESAIRESFTRIHTIREPGPRRTACLGSDSPEVTRETPGRRRRACGGRSALRWLLDPAWRSRYGSGGARSRARDARRRAGRTTRDLRVAIGGSREG